MKKFFSGNPVVPNTVVSVVKKFKNAGAPVSAVAAETLSKFWSGCFTITRNTLSAAKGINSAFWQLVFSIHSFIVT